MGDYRFWFHGFKLYSQKKTRSAGQVEDVAVWCDERYHRQILCYGTYQ